MYRCVRCTHTSTRVLTCTIYSVWCAIASRSSATRSASYRNSARACVFRCQHRAVQYWSRTDTEPLASSIARHQCNAGPEAERMLSTRPSRKRRVDALSYVCTSFPCALRAHRKSRSLHSLEQPIHDQFHSFPFHSTVLTCQYSVSHTSISRELSDPKSARRGGSIAESPAMPRATASVASINKRAVSLLAHSIDQYK